MELVGGQGFESLWQCSRCFVLCLGCVVAVGTGGSVLLYWEPGYAKKGYQGQGICDNELHVFGTIRGRRIRHRWRIMGSRVRLVLPIAIPNLCSPPSTIIKSMKEIAKLRFQCIKTEVYLVKVLNTKSLSKKHCFNIFHAL